jgi:hypothetical protein
VTTIRFLAQELYRLTRKVEELEKTLPTASLAERARLETYRHLLAAKKEKPIV